MYLKKKKKKLYRKKTLKEIFKKRILQLKKNLIETSVNLNFGT